ncbi:MAG: hypothetical protein Alpg2KO_18380 [Alphaproteobacteria bacterium]
MALADCSEVHLSAAGKEVLTDISEIESSAGLAKTIVTLSPIALVYSNSLAVDMAFTAATQDYAAHKEAVGALSVIANTNIRKAINYHIYKLATGQISDRGRCRQKFFEQLKKQYQ